MLTVTLILLLPLLLHATPPPRACTSDTCYKGSWLDATDFGPTSPSFASFQGIRYAQPPVGKLRYRPSQPYSPAEPEVDVSQEDDVKCPQPGWGTGGFSGQEDCLYLNVYTPDAGQTSPLPVMVWIHGGSLAMGNKNYESFGPQHLVTRGVVVVTVNYRLGVLGFLSLGNEAVPGNAGLTDQAMALRWVHDNIASFGGDPSKVTIFGESAGSFSVALQLLSPLSEGLFQRAIMQSSTAVDVQWAPITPDHAVRFSQGLATNLGCDQGPELLSCLQNKPFEQVFSASHLDGVKDDSTWMPVPDGQFTSRPFLPGPPMEMMKKGDINKEVKEVIIGMNKDEGIMFLTGLLADPSTWDSFRENFSPRELFMKAALPSKITDEDKTNFEKVVRYYLGSVDNINADHTQGVIDMFTDASSGWYGLYRTASLLSKKITVFPYVLTHQGQNSMTKMMGLPKLVGVCHSDDLFYLWNPYEHMRLNLNKEDSAVREIMSEAWTSFAKRGNPSPRGFTWNPLTKDTLDGEWAPENRWFFNISGSNPAMAASNDIYSRIELWNSLDHLDFE